MLAFCAVSVELSPLPEPLLAVTSACFLRGGMLRHVSFAVCCLDPMSEFCPMACLSQCWLPTMTMVCPVMDSGLPGHGFESLIMLLISRRLARPDVWLLPHGC